MSVFPPKRCQKFLDPPMTTAALAAQRHHNSLRLASSALHIVVHYTIVVVFAKSGNLVPGTGQAPLDFFVRVLTATSQPSLQLLRRRRHNKNRDGLRNFLFYLGRPLNVNLKNQIESLAASFVEPFFWRAV